MPRILVYIVLIALLTACAPAGVGITPTAPSATPTGDVISSPGDGNDSTPPGSVNPDQPQESDSQLKRGNVFIDTAQMLVLESYPPQYRLSITGSLPTPCHKLRLVVGQPDATNRIDVEAYSVYDPGTVCVQVLKPFEAVLSLDGFASGKYSIWLNGEAMGEIEVPAPLDGTSMKGWEIYSWQVDGTWYYSLLVGTNRNKTLEEVQDPAVRLESIEALKERLSQLAEGEWVTWLVLDYGGLELPPQTVQDEIRAWAEEHGLNFQTAVH